MKRTNYQENERKTRVSRVLKFNIKKTTAKLFDKFIIYYSYNEKKINDGT